MQDPEALRARARLIRAMALRSSKRRQARGRSYLLKLAARVELEAERLEREMAGKKPNIARQQDGGASDPTASAAISPPVDERLASDALSAKPKGDEKTD